MKVYLVQYMPLDRDFWQYRMFPENMEDNMKEFAKKCKEEDCAVRIYVCERLVKENKKK